MNFKNRNKKTAGLIPASIRHLIGRVRKSILQQGVIRCKKDNKSRDLVWGFTLLELLIVIAILSVLATAVVLVLNPAQYLKQSRDTKRISEISALNTAIQLFDLQNPGFISGQPPTNVYISIPDPGGDPDCAGVAGLPPLPPTYSYKCVGPNNLTKTDSTGWVPLNLDLPGTGSPIATLPVDPINDTSHFYIYIPGGSWGLSSFIESDKFLKSTASTDGGTNPYKLEIGSDLALLTKADGLVGYWPLDEGSGTIANDRSSEGNNGTLINSPTWGTGKIGNALTFNGTNTRVDIGSQAIFNVNVGESKTISGWFKGGAQGTLKQLFWKEGSCIGWYIAMNANGTIRISMHTGNSGCTGYNNYNFTSGGNYADNQWHHAAGVINRPGSSMKLFIDGALAGSTALDNINSGTGGSLKFGTNYQGESGTQTFNGQLDEIQIYNRALTDTEIKSMYDAQK